MENKKQVETVAEVKQTATAPTVCADKAAFLTLVQSAMGVSPLAYGRKFESDDLVAAISPVTLTELDLVDYKENEGTPNEKDVHFALWRVTVETSQDTFEDGYYQSGTVLTRLGDYIRNAGLENDLRTYGVKIKASWGKTTGGQKILKVDLVN